MQVIISSGGRFHAFHLAQQLAKRNALQHMYTFSATDDDKRLLGASRIKQYFWGAVLDQSYYRLRLNNLCTPSRYNTYKDLLFDRWVDKQLALQNNFDLFIGWANYVANSIAHVRTHGAKIIVESGSCHIAEQQVLLEQEYDRLGLRFEPITQKNCERMMYEYEAADYIMTLSTFARNSFIKRGFTSKKILQVPCGVDIDYFLSRPLKNIASKRKKIRFIFVGLLSVRKGVHHLIDAWEQLNFPEQTAELVLVGPMRKDLQKIVQYKTLKKNILFYGSASRASVKALYQEASVFILPSLEDGFGMVMGEAMATGLPVICTKNSGAPDVITNGHEGFLIDAGNVQQLVEKLEWCYKNPELAQQMGHHGRETIQGYSWDRYGEQVYNVYETITR